MSKALEHIIREMENERARTEEYRNSPQHQEWERAVYAACEDGGVAISCKCGHVDKWDAFETSQDRFQCPKCKVKFAITFGKSEWVECPETEAGGFWKPGTKRVTYEQA